MFRSSQKSHTEQLAPEQRPRKPEMKRGGGAAFLQWFWGVWGEEGRSSCGSRGGFWDTPMRLIHMRVEHLGVGNTDRTAFPHAAGNPRVAIFFFFLV